MGLAHLVGISWPWIALAAAALHFIIALVLLLIAWSRITKPFFRVTLAELRKDREWLRNLDDNKSIDELRAEIAGSRERVGRDLRGLHHELDFPAKFRRSFRDQTVSWITAATAVGALIALAPMRRKKIYVDAKSSRKSQKKLVETGFALAALKIVGSLARPVILEFVKNRLTDFQGKSRAQNIRSMSAGLREALVLGFTRSPALRNCFLRRQ